MSSAVLRTLVRAVAHVLVAGVLATVLTPLPAGADDEVGPVRYVEPVDAPVVDGFRPPPGPYGAGNRGLEYDTQPGQPVRTAAPGVVVFAGDVAGALHVTVLHADGRRSSYSFLATIGVRTGQRLGPRAVVGSAGARLHVGVREGDDYVDPAALFGTEVTVVHLVPENPLGSPTWNRGAAEIAELARLTLLEGGPGLFDRAWGALGGAADVLWSHVEELGPDFLDLVLWVAEEIGLGHPLLDIVVFQIVVPLARGEESPLWNALRQWNPYDVVVRTVQRGIDWWEHRSTCTPADVDPPRPTERRIAVLVAGLDSTSSDGAIGELDTAALGYAQGDVVGFSYAGGRIPGSFDGGPGGVSSDLASLPMQGYGGVDSTTSIARRGVLLADLLEDVAAASPGQPIDLYGHSQGGVVVRLAIADLARRPGGDEVIASLGLVATMASPHQGSDLATVAVVAAETGEGQIGLPALADATGLPVDPGEATNIADLALGSELIAGLEASGLPAGPSYLSLGARGDPIVPDARAELDGAEHVTLPITGLNAHAEVPGHAATTRELGLAMAGMGSTCRSLWHVGVDAFLAETTLGIHVRIGVAAPLLAAESLVPTWISERATDVLDG